MMGFFDVFEKYYAKNTNFLFHNQDSHYRSVVEKDLSVAYKICLSSSISAFRAEYFC
jgi:hypothetical protein